MLLYSAPPCDAGSRMKVRFQSADGFTQDTPYKACSGGLSMNFYLAGLRAETEYFAYHIIDTGDSFESGPVLTHTTRGISTDLPATTILQRHRWAHPNQSFSRRMSSPVNWLPIWRAAWSGTIPALPSVHDASRGQWHVLRHRSGSAG